MNKQLPWLFLILLMAVCISGCSRQTVPAETKDAPPASFNVSVGDFVTENDVGAQEDALTEEPQSGNDVSASDDADLTRSVMSSTLARRIPEEEAKTYNDYFSQIREETLLAADDPWGDFVSYVRQSDGMLCLRHSGNSKMELSYSLRASQNVYTSHTLRKIYCASEDQATLMQVDPISGAAIELYHSEGKLDSIYCGRNIVVFTVESLDGTWHVLRLYEPDGTVDVLEAGLSKISRIEIVNNCEFVTMWENPAYTKAVKTYGETIWNSEYDTPYPASTAADDVCFGNFLYDYLPYKIYDDYGIFTWFTRYRNTMSGKTVTLGCKPYSDLFYTYIRPDGSEWMLSTERRISEEYTYNTVRFWLYLPDDDAEKNMQAAAEAEKGSVMADSGYTSITLSLPPANSTAFASSPLLEKLATRIPEPEERTYDMYFSEIRSEDKRHTNNKNDMWPGFSFHIDDNGCLYLSYRYETSRVIGGKRHSRFEEKGLCYPFVAAPTDYTCDHTLRKVYCLSEDEKSLMQIDPITAETVAVYTTEGTLKPPEFGWEFGRNIVVFTEQDANGNWRVLRLYEPDGTIDVIEESIPTEPSLNIISNCEFLTMWENPAYTKAAETYGESIWNKLNTTKPYPTTEEEKWLPGNEHFFHDVLPLEIYKTYGIFDRYVRYRNTLTGKTVTLGSTQYNCRFSTYILPDGTEWRLSAERREYEDGNYNMVRFWLYLPADQ